MLTGHAAHVISGEIPGVCKHIAGIVAAAHRAGAIHIRDHTANAAATGHICLVAAVFNRTGFQISDHTGHIRRPGHFAAHDEVFHRAAVDAAEQTDRRAGRDVQPAHDVISAVERAFERCAARADRRPWAAFAAQRNIRRQRDGFSFICIAVVDVLRELPQLRSRRDGHVRRFCRSRQRHRRQNQHYGQYCRQKRGKCPVPFDFH